MTDFRLKVVNGDDLEIVCNVKDKDDVAIDLSGITAATFRAKTTPDGDLFIDKSLGAGVVVDDAVNGILKITLTNSDTSDSNLPANEYLFEIQITDASGNISTVRGFDDGFGCLDVLQDLDS